MPADLHLGPVLRHVDAGSATVWVETSARAAVTVRVAGHAGSAQTFEVEGHHYALIVVEGLPSELDAPYTVELDGRQVWPRPDDERPAPRIRTFADDTTDLSIVFGSCRVDRPHEEPYTLPVDQHPQGVGLDALVTLATECQRGRPLPDLLLLLGDQVYGDEGLSPVIRERQVQRRGPDSEPRAEVADFEEYTWLYRDTWGDPEVRWLLSTVPSAMVFDDHDVRDDWNTSQTWRRTVRQLPWWPARITGAYMSYWIYQHIGNLSPARLARDKLYQQVLAGAGSGGDEAAELRAFAAQADEEIDDRKPSLWSYQRHLGRSRLVVIDTRSGRLLEGDRREMLSADEWGVVEKDLTGDVEHLLVASSLPVVLERAIHDLEAWDEALANGRVWGSLASRLAERLRQALDLEHWAAFEDSFRRLVIRLGEVAAGRHGAPPATVLLLSGDVHHSYVAPLRYPPSAGVRAPVVQVTSSPLRNAFARSAQRMFRLAHTAPARAVGRLLRRSARLRPLPVRWSVTGGPWFGNGVGWVHLTQGKATIRLERAEPAQQSSRLVVVHEQQIPSE